MPYIIGHPWNETLNGSNVLDIMYGDTNGTIAGTAHGGSDRIFGNWGDDGIRGDADMLTGYAIGGNDVIYGDNGTGGPPPSSYTDNDTIWGDADLLSQHSRGGSDHLYGGSGNDNLIGDGILYDYASGGDDFLYGGRGDDYLEGDGSLYDRAVGGNDRLDGGDGNDTLIGDGSSMTSYTIGGKDTLYGGSGDDKLFGDDNPFVEGEHRGRGGADELHGGTGNDLICGGGGDDQLWGDAGNDTFLFSPRFGNDVIHDFGLDKAADNHDIIELAGFSASALSSMYIADNSEGNAVIHIGLDTITLLGVHANQLSASEFLMV